MKKVFMLLFYLLIIIGCKDIDIEIQEHHNDSGFVWENDTTEFVMSNDVLERAYQMASIEWTPLNPVPKRGGGYYDPGVKVKGVPYSSVKEINTYLFQDVSYYTFMTAVHNPNSVLYTEDISQAPYHGVNCAPYYGAVCSSSVMWALGFKIPYYANQIVTHPNMKLIENRIIDSLKICDIIWKPGHVQMIFDMDYLDDTLYSISTFETKGESSHINNFTKRNFQKMWDEGAYVGYRYEKIRYSYTPPTFSGFNQIEYNDDMCPTKGDKAVYRTTDTVTVNIFNTSYDTIVLSKENVIISSTSINGEKHKYSHLGPGIYIVNLRYNGKKSAPTSFEVIETNVQYQQEGGNNIMIYFQSSATAEYVALCDEKGSSLCYPISELDRMLGFKRVQILDQTKSFCKVIFKGEFGRITNEPIRIMGNIN